MTTSRTKIISGIAAALLVASAGLWFTTSRDRGPVAGARSGDGNARSGDDEVVQAIADKYLTTTPRVQPLATVEGTLDVRGTRVPGRLDVVALDAGDTSTALRFRLSSPVEVKLRQASLASGERQVTVSGVVLESKQTDQRLVPAELVQENLRQCTCSNAPLTVGPAGVESSAVYGALAPEATEVTVKVPGFAPVTVPVERR